ncbi:GDSL-type esterase/lipase family protein [Shewanella sp. C32]|uniref:GDSL-type esterase/lipase family protein n=1 Tax=Shewanella electrica TaxID=515560 RepID=A0ABT2FQI5_9GAMM|nr:GDSL-type esterase/lipase family protein [Shewanella electrica]MCH1926670.1 GDSL-type esterase/lipase family protein [Shewanella electrica]MCS4558291.1 GDSL-type esterase/lipase family protein [Shewanella electrica]
MRWIVLLLLTGLVACSKPSLPPLDANATLLAFGDSLTAGVGAAAGDDYPSQLAHLCGCQVINAGISGETTSQGLQRLPNILDETQPDVLLLLEGGNDILRNQSLAQMQQNLAMMITEAKGRGIDVLLISVPEKSLFLAPSPIYSALADEFKLPLLDHSLSQLLREPKLKSDTVHLNAQGYQQLAQQIFDKLQQEGAFSE